MRNRRLMAAVVAIFAVTGLARHPSANIQIITHDAADLAPHRVKAALDLGWLRCRCW